MQVRKRVIDTVLANLKIPEWWTKQQQNIVVPSQRRATIFCKITPYTEPLKFPLQFGVIVTAFQLSITFRNAMPPRNYFPENPTHTIPALQVVFYNTFVLLSVLTSITSRPSIILYRYASTTRFTRVVFVAKYRRFEMASNYWLTILS
jgi:hypothetical protein